MKKLISGIAFFSIVISSICAQSVSEYTYKLANGLTVKTERGWNQVWVQQSYAPIAATDKMPLSVNIRALGDLISNSSFNLLNKGKEVKMQGAAPGTYDLKMTFKLSGTPGSLSFVANNIVIKPNTKTAVSVTLYDYQINILETPASNKGLASVSTKVDRYRGASFKNLNEGVTTFYAKGKHDSPIAPDEKISESEGKIKPGAYDVLVTINISGQKQKVWLENFLMKADINYKLTLNLNGGAVAYTGGNKDVKMLHLYPAGTAARQTGTPAPVKNIEIINYDTPTEANACSPGTYDVLLNYKNGSKYEWKKNIVVTTGLKAEVK